GKPGGRCGPRFPNRRGQPILDRAAQCGGFVIELQRPLILLVEDDANDVLLFRRAFNKSALDAALITMEGAESAERYLVEDGSPGCAHPPSLAILDLKLPGKSGLELLAWIRSRENLRMMPVVIFSSSGEPADVRAAYELGANSYIVKPAGSD